MLGVLSAWIFEVRISRIFSCLADFIRENFELSNEAVIVKRFFARASTRSVLLAISIVQRVGRIT